MLFFCLTSTNIYKTNTDNDILEGYIAQIADNDTSALAELYSKTSDSVYGFALSLLKNTYDAEDVLHDCYLNIFSAAANYRPDGKPMAWILTITRNLCLMKIREYKRTNAEVPEDWEKYIEEKESITPEDKIVIHACMQCLSDSERQIVVLHAVSGFKHREIAEILTVPLPTVLSKYRRALKKLKDQIMKGEQNQ